MQSLAEIAKKLTTLKSALIFTHTRPDGDTLGCAFALKKGLEQKGISADVICADDVPEKYAFLGIISAKKSNAIDRKYDAHVAVDCSVESMHGENFALFTKNNNTFNIDHHVSNSRYAKYNYVEDVGACCMIIYKLLVEMQVTITKDIANFLMLGICTDTGNFAHSNVTGETLNISGKLIDLGANLHDINYEMFKRQSKNRALLFGNVMEKIQFFHDDKLAVITLNHDLLKKFDADSSVTEGFIDFPLSITGVEVAVSIFEYKEKQFKISLRSKGKVDVNEIASAYGGGGHVLASGCMLSGYYEDVLEKLVYRIGTSL